MTVKMVKPDGGVDLFDGYITCYEDGRIWSNRSGKFVGALCNQGYLNVTIQKNGKPKRYRSHRLIANAFLGLDLESDLTVDHLNKVKTDNRVINLDVVTLEENVSRAQKLYVHTREQVLESLCSTNSWTVSAKNLGFYSGACLQAYAENTLGISKEETRPLVSARKNYSACSSLRNMDINTLLDLIADDGISAAAKDFGVSASFLTELLREKASDNC